MDNIITIILATAGVSTAVSTIANHVMTFGKIGNKAVNKYVDKALSPHFDKIHNELDTIKDQINEIKDENDKREMQRLRYECLKFASDVRKGVKKTPREYEEIFRMEQSYEVLIKSHNIKNGFMVEEMRYVHESYRKICD